MKNRIVKYSTFVLIVTLFSFCLPKDTKDLEKRDVMRAAMMKSLQLDHYLDMRINDAFSLKVYDLYIKSLDYNKKFLIESDISVLNSFSTKLDDEINEGGFAFLDTSVGIINKRIAQAETYFEEFLNKPFDFTVKEDIELDSKKLQFAKSEADLKDAWRKSLKYQVLVKYVENIERQEKAEKENDTSYVAKNIDTLEKQARLKVLKSHRDWFKRLKRLDETDRLNTYMKCITLAYDPHSAFYPPKEKEDFDISISGKLEGIGATLQEKDGYIEVIRIVAGSASWKQGDLKSGDVILKVAQGEEEPVDIVDMRLDEAVRLIRGPKGTEVRLTVKKKLDGMIKVIPIIRDVVILEETYAKSAVVKHEKIGSTIGYINLPKFYADFSGRGGRSCSKDVKKELEKLQLDKVEGIVIDLRDNGGGSLSDVVDMAGLFIPKGPIVQVKSRTGAPSLYGDLDPRVQYDGPLVILVNTFSASASEILAAAIQDYKRGVIIGTPTYGKGTVQRFADLDRYLKFGDTDFKPLGSIKLTTQKFYRINGGATQLKGVIPDIILPDTYSYIDIGEREMDCVMPWDEIAPAEYDISKVFRKKINKVVKKSKKRVAKSDIFSKIREQAQYLKTQRDITVYSLNLDEYRKNEDRLKKESEKYKNLQPEIKEFEILTPTADEKLVKSNETKTETNKQFQKGLKNDPYLLEAIRVIKDMKYKKKKK